MSGALVLSDVSVARAGRRVVSGVSLEVPAGEITALLGPNGAGKSSLVLALSGVVPLAGGDVMLDGTRISGLRPERIRATGLATVPEGHRVLGDLTVADNLRVAAGDLGKRELAGAVARVHELFGELAALSARRAASLSGGQQQMLALGQALIGRPRYLIVDELSLGLAPVVVRRLAPALDEIAAGGVGVLLIEQFTSLALRLATRAHVLVRGALRLSEPAAALRERPELLEASYRLGSGPATADSPI